MLTATLLSIILLNFFMAGDKETKAGGGLKVPRDLKIFMLTVTSCFLVELLTQPPKSMQSHFPTRNTTCSLSLGSYKNNTHTPQYNNINFAYRLKSRQVRGAATQGREPRYIISAVRRPILPTVFSVPPNSWRNPLQLALLQTSDPSLVIVWSNVLGVKEMV